jgi:hypothetical protein
MDEGNLIFESFEPGHVVSVDRDGERSQISRIARTAVGFRGAGAAGNDRLAQEGAVHEERTRRQGEATGRSAISSLWRTAFTSMSFGATTFAFCCSSSAVTVIVRESGEFIFPFVAFAFRQIDSLAIAGNG